VPAVERGIDMAVDAVATQYVRADSGRADDSSVELEVREVWSLDDYARVLGYLETVDRVEGVRVTRAEPGTVRFRLYMRGAGDSLAQSFALGNTLGRVGVGGEWSYQLLP
jgi:hypothetical protein